MPIDKNLVGLYLFVAFKRKLLSRRQVSQKNIVSEKVKSGMYGSTGNKGAVLLRFVVGD